MQKYDDIIVGSGISGLTMALLLASNGRRVLLLEKGPQIGGSLAGFSRNGARFDIGFHFTGGLQPGGILHNMLSALRLQDAIQPVFLPEETASAFILESESRRFNHPYGIEHIKQKFKAYFPGEASAIDKYFDMVRSVCARTPSMDIRVQVFAPPNLEEDFVSLEAVLDGLTQNRALKALLSGFCMCYGVKPSEISFANHSRVCLSFYESVAFVKGGGDAFIDAFLAEFKRLPVEVCCGRHIVGLADIRDSKVGRFILNTGEEVAADNCLFTIHPAEILKLLPQEGVSKAFVNRVSAFEPAIGFFVAFAVLGAENKDVDSNPSILSLFPDLDVNKLLDSEYTGTPALVIIKSADRTAGGDAIIHILAPAGMRQTAPWQDSVFGARPEEYQAYKAATVAHIKERLDRALPEYRNGLEILDSASRLTFRDYLNNPDGSAYGIKQKIGQYNLLGRLPLRNLYAAGQSAVLPGIAGAMMSSFVVGRSVLGKEQYDKFLKQNL